MTFLSEDVLDLNAKYSREDLVYTFTNGVPASLVSIVTGSATVTAADSADPLGSALKMTVAANPGTIVVTGPKISQAAIKAVLIDLEGVSLYSVSGVQLPIWSVGLYTAATTTDLVDLYCDPVNSGGSFLSRIRSGKANVFTVTKMFQLNAPTDAGAVPNMDQGLLVNFAKQLVSGHVQHSYSSVATNIPTVDLYFKLKAQTSSVAGYSDYSVYVRKITLSIWC